MLQSTPYFEGPRCYFLTKGAGGRAYKAWLDTQIRHMTFAGATVPQMSVALRVGETSIWRYAKALGLTNTIRRAPGCSQPIFWDAVQRFQADRAAAVQPLPDSMKPGRMQALLRQRMSADAVLGSATVAALHEIGLCLDDLASLGVSYVDAVAAIREHHGVAQSEGM